MYHTILLASCTSSDVKIKLVVLYSNNMNHTAATFLAHYIFYRTFVARPQSYFVTVSSTPSLESLKRLHMFSYSDVRVMIAHQDK